MKEILSKIRKLLALSKSSNVNEAALALKQAQKLLTEYNLSLSQVRDDDPIQVLETELKIREKWKRLLAQVIAEANYCSTLELQTHDVRTLHRSRFLQFVGREVNVECAHEMYKYILGQLVYFRKQYCKVNNIKGMSTSVDSYMMGITAELHRRVNSKDGWSSVENALVVQEKKIVDEFCSKYDKSKPLGLKAKDQEALHDGIKDAHKISLERQVQSSAQTLQLT